MFSSEGGPELAMRHAGLIWFLRPLYGDLMTLWPRSLALHYQNPNFDL